MPILSPGDGLHGLSPAKIQLADRSPRGHPNQMTSPNMSTGMFSDDHFLLHSLDGNMYDHASGTGHIDHDLGNHHLQTDFALDNLDFIVPDDLGEESRAFPPLNYPQNTPSLMAHGHASIVRNLLPGAIQSPILPGQNQKSYNQEHLYHKQRQQRQQALISSLAQNPPKHIHPDAVFTPLVSPAGTPLDLQINSNGQSKALLRDFEPLTSPALKAQPKGVLQSLPSSERIRPLSTINDDYTSGNSTKRKTPHLTPNLQAHTASKHSKSPVATKVPQPFESLPEASFDGLGALAKSTETTPMLPPQSKRVPIDNSSSSTPGSAGPSTMMGFTMNRLAEQQSGSYETPTNGKTSKPPRRLSRSSSQRSVDYSGKHYASSLSETSPLLEAQQDSGEYGISRNGKLPTKKTSHKLAEQGRRNRMNHAIQELSCLIPTTFHERAAVPSKATTVELAAEYISTLLKEIEDLKKPKRKIKQEQ